MWYVLGLPSMKDWHKLAQVEAYLKVCADLQHPLHDKLGQITTQNRHIVDDPSSSNWGMWTLCGGNKKGRDMGANCRRSKRQIHPGDCHTWTWVPWVALGIDTRWNPGSDWGELRRKWNHFLHRRLHSAWNQIRLGLYSCVPRHNSTGGIRSDRPHHVQHVYVNQGNHWRA